MNIAEQRVPVGVGAIVIKDGRILIGRRMGKNGLGTWSMPGGHLDMGESPEMTAARETLEETGVVVDNIQFIGYTNDIFPEKEKHYLTLWMAGWWVSGEPHMTATREMDELRWVSLDDLPDGLFLPLVNLLESPFKQVLQDAVEGRLV